MSQTPYVPGRDYKYDGGGRREVVLNAIADALVGMPGLDAKLAALQRPADVRQQGFDFGAGGLVPGWVERLAASADNEGGLLTNSPPCTRTGQGEGEAAHEGAGKFSGGEDTLAAVLYVHWDEWDRLRAKLEKVKEIAKEIRDGSDHELPLINGKWIMQAEAIHTKGGGPSFRYVMKSDGVTLAIANMASPKGDCPNVKVEFGSLRLMTSELRHEWGLIIDEIDSLGGVPEKSKPSRVDGCVDLPGVPTPPIVEKFRQRHFVSRARKLTDNFDFPEDGAPLAAQVHGTTTKDTGFTFGRGMLIRVYDKLEETKRDDIKRQVMIERRWNGETPEHATRVEFQLRREHLKSMGVDSMEDYFERRADIWAYMCDAWFRFTEGAVDRENRNQGVAPTWSFWNEVRAAFVAWAGAERIEVVRRKVRVFNLDALARQVLGCVLSVYAHAQGVTNDVGEVAAFAFDYLTATLSGVPEKELARRLSRKRDLQDAVIPRSGAVAIAG